MNYILLVIFQIDNYFKKELLSSLVLFGGWRCELGNAEICCKTSTGNS